MPSLVDLKEVTYGKLRLHLAKFLVCFISKQFRNKKGFVTIIKKRKTGHKELKLTYFGGIKQDIRNSNWDGDSKGNV